MSRIAKPAVDESSNTPAPAPAANAEVKKMQSPEDILAAIRKRQQQ